MRSEPRLRPCWLITGCINSNQDVNVLSYILGGSPYRSTVSSFQYCIQSFTIPTFFPSPLIWDMQVVWGLHAGSPDSAVHYLWQSHGRPEISLECVRLHRTDRCGGWDQWLGHLWSNGEPVTNFRIVCVEAVHVTRSSQRQVWVWCICNYPDEQILTDSLVPKPWDTKKREFFRLAQKLASLTLCNSWSLCSGQEDQYKGAPGGKWKIDCKIKGP